MAADSPRIRPEELLQHAGWLQALAAGLVADPAAADDVVQDTYLAALRTRPDAARDLVPWLARVTRNFAKKRRRSEGRRAAREQAVARPDAVTSPDAILERLELQRILAEELSALDEPWRSVVVLRHVEGRTSVEIAALLAVPEGTVRWRLKRALELLRARLDRRFGGSRKAWSVLLAPLASRAREGAAAGPGAGAAATGTFAASGVLGLCALLASALVAGVLWWAMRSLPPAGGGTAAAVARSQLAAHAPQDALSAPGAGPPARTSAEEIAPPAPPAGAGAVPSEAPARAPARVEARFLDAAGHPLPGVLFESRAPASLRTASGPDGRAALEFEVPEPVTPDWRAQLVARLAGSETRTFSTQLAGGSTSHLGDVALGLAGTLDVLVVDAAGLAVDGADVWTVPAGVQDDESFRPLRAALFGPYEREQRTGPEARTGVDGRARLADVAAGEWRVVAHKQGWSYALSDGARLQSGAVVDVRVVLARLGATDRIAGRVVDPDGQPVAHPLVRYTVRSGARAALAPLPANERGEFELLLEPDAHYDLVASDRERRFTEAVALDVRHGELQLVLQLSEPRFVAVRVEDGAGAGFAGAVLVSHCERAFEYEDVRTPVDAAGRALVAIPRTRFVLTATADGRRPARLGPFEPDAVPDELVFELVPLPLLRGTVRAGGVPVAGARVELREQVPEGLLSINRFPCRMRDGAAAQATTDAEGRYALGVPRAAHYFVRAAAPGWAPAELGPLDLRGQAAPDGADLALGTGGTIAGHVVASDGRDTAGTVVAINHGDGHPLTTRAGPGGAYRFDGLATGSWQVRVQSEELRHDIQLRDDRTSAPDAGPGAAIEWSCAVADGRTTVHDLRVDPP